MYDFDMLYPRDNCASEKWDLAAHVGRKPGTVPLTVADMEFRTAPEIIEAVQQTAAFGLWGYTYGNEEFKAITAGWMRRRHGWDAKGEWVVNTAGIVPAMYTAIRTFTQPGDRILVQPPVYPPFFSAATANNRVVLENPLQIINGRYEMDFEDLRQKAPLARMMLLCSPHNPVGRVWSREELLQVAEICHENKVLLFVDEIHCDILQPPNRFVPFGTLPAQYANHCLIGTAASKTFSLAGLACSSVFIPEAGLRAAFTAGLAKDAAMFNSTFGLVATKAAYQSGEAWLDELLIYLEKNYRLVQEFLAENLSSVEVAPLEGTYLAWLNFSAFGLSDAQLDEFLRIDAGVFVTAGTYFGTGGQGHARMNLACPRAVLQAALEQLYTAAKQRGFVSK